MNVNTNDDDPVPSDDMSSALQHGSELSEDHEEMGDADLDLAPDFPDTEDDGAPVPTMDVEGEAEHLDDDPAPKEAELGAEALLDEHVDSEGDPSPIGA